MYIAIVDFLLLTLLVCSALIVLFSHRLIHAGMLFGFYSLLMASVFVTLDAVDVAFTEAAVGAGISTLLILATLAITGSQEEGNTTRHVPATILTLVLGVALIIGTGNMPDVGDPNAPANRHVAPTYLTESEAEIGIPNVVTSVLASYRGYDTLGEVAVIFTAGLGVLCLLSARRRRRHSEQITPEEQR